MKKQLFTLALLFVGAIANAQISKGDVHLGGGFHFLDVTFNESESSNFGITPNVGFLLSDNISLGAYLGYVSRSYEVFDRGLGDLVDRKESEFRYGVFARFYKKPADNFYLFLEPYFQLTSGDKDDYNGDELETNGIRTGLAVGMSYFISPKFAVEFTAGSIHYSSTTNDNAGTKTKDTNFRAILDIANVGLGISYFIK